MCIRDSEKPLLLQTCCCDSVCGSKRGLRVSDNSTTQCLLFPDIFPKPAVLQFDHRQGSSDGGALLLKAADRRYGLIACMADCLRDQRQAGKVDHCLLYTSPSPRDRTRSRMPS